jgi:hypothetical protein
VKRITWRRTDNPTFIGYVRDSVTKALVDISAATITSQARMTRFGQNEFVHTFTATATPTLGQFQLSSTVAEVAAWPAGEMICDILVVDPSNRRHTEKFIIDVQDVVTA